MLLGVDVGGTFTDAVLVDDGRLHSAKVATTPDDQSRGVLAAVAAVLERAGASRAAVRRFAHGMTVATNALLEGRGARTALVATEGFTDLVELGRQARPSLYRLCEAAPPPLAPAQLRFAAPERMGPDGPLRPLQAQQAAAVADALARARPEAVAVVLLHSYAHPEHERLLGELIAERLPDAHLSLSHEVVGTFREFERAATTEVDAALAPLVAGYLRRLAERARAAGLPQPDVMQSSGGLIGTEQAAAHAAFTALSGPAGGAGGALLLAKRAGVRDVLCFDMGGTSCDVCVVDDLEVRETTERRVAGRPLALPMLDIHTVGAGGGSIAWRDAGGALRVGPQSAGAVPGPACYGLGGGEPTVTDANLLLGRLPGDHRLAGGVQLDPEAAERAIARLARELGLSPRECALGVVRVTDAEMVGALRVMTVARGVDPRGYALMPFGGAGPLHAAAIAEQLGISRILCPRASGVLSALGLAAAAPRRDAARSVLRSGATFTREQVARDACALLERAAGELGGEPARTRLRYELRYSGQSFELAVEADVDAEPDELRAAFAREHERRYGYSDPEGEVELVTVRASVWGPAPRLWQDQRADDATAGGEPARSRQSVVFAEGELEAELLRGEPPAGAAIAGPAIVALPEATLAVPPAWSGTVDDAGTIVLERRLDERRRRGQAGLDGPHWPRKSRPDGGSGMTLDPITLQVVAGALRAACEEMGAVLIRSAQSANIKERRDASTALFDPRGEMIMQAEHIPVHLGAMPASVAAVRDAEHVPGRSWILNDPFAGGSHLPDITVVTPVFGGGDSGPLIGFAASRAHHADVGGSTPGSMPADSRTLEEEGVVISPRPLDEPTIAELVARMRQPAERRADLRAQLAANRVGARRLAELAERVGSAGLSAACASVLDYAERRMRAQLTALPDGERRAQDVLEAVDRDLQLQLAARIEGDRLVLDFSGSAAQHDGNLNCPIAVTCSACYFAVRVLTDPEIPPNAGAHRPIEVLAPAGSLLNARPRADGVAPAVVGGNVETSSRVADLVLAAFGRALGQGTMNNVTVGNERFTYYETVGGGQGACPDADGPSGVHVAMSNTLNTPIEALERDFPLRVVRYELRRGSGGAGRWHGGDGVVRELEALEPMTYSLITERRRHAPPGADGGQPGAPGRNRLNGEQLSSKATGRLHGGDRLRLDTPGGGGHGRA